MTNLVVVRQQVAHIIVSLMTRHGNFIHCGILKIFILSIYPLLNICSIRRSRVFTVVVNDCRLLRNDSCPRVFAAVWYEWRIIAACYVLSIAYLQGIISSAFWLYEYAQLCYSMHVQNIVSWVSRNFLKVWVAIVQYRIFNRFQRFIVKSETVFCFEIHTFWSELCDDSTV